MTEKKSIKPMSKVTVIFRLVLKKIVVFWFFWLRVWAKNYHQPILENGGLKGHNKEFYLKNRELQKELCQIFAPYYQFCPCLKESCCLFYNQPDETFRAPRNVVDGIIHDLPAHQITRTREFNLRDIADGLRRQLSLLSIQPSSSIQEGEPAPCAELTKTGCGLPVGERPLTCILALCETFARYMTWHDFWRYWVASLKYLTYLTFHLRNIQAGLAERSL